MGNNSEARLAADQPLVTVGMPVYNEERFLEQAVSAILGQTYGNFELILADNASEDRTQEICEHFARIDKRVKYMRHPTNIGPNRTSTKVLEASSGVYHMWAAGHDLWDPRYIERLLARMRQDPSLVLCYGKTTVIDAANGIICDMKTSIDTRGLTLRERFRKVINEIFNGCMVYGLFRTDVLKSKLWNEHKVVGPDHVIVAKLALLGPMAYVDEPLFFLRQNRSENAAEVLQRQIGWFDLSSREACVPWVLHAHEHLRIVEQAELPDLQKELLYADVVECFTGKQFHGMHLGEVMNGETVKLIAAGMSVVNDREMGRLSKVLALNDLWRLAAICRPFCTRDEKDLDQFMALCSRLSGELACGAPHLAAPASQPASSQRTKGQVRIAGAGVLGKDLTQIQESSEFEEQLQELVTRVRPASIIETGTYLGTGTTRIIASALRKAGLFETKFYTIECNPRHYQQAVGNLARNGLDPFVTTLLGLSVPRALLPDMARIEEETVKNVEWDGIFVDHQEENRAAFYYGETNFSEVSDDLLGQCLERLDYTPSIVLLDSGGHLGNVEFNYLVGKLKGECYVVLDDVYHVKHHKSFQQIKEDPRFTVITSSQEKFGFCMAHFDPKKGAAPAPGPRNILFIRSDSIGDSILAMTTLKPIKERFSEARLTVLCQEHVAPLYEACPYCDDVVTVDTGRALEDEAYREELRGKLQGAAFDLCLNGTYSRSILSDFLSFAAGAPATVALEGDLSNISQEDRKAGNNVYSTLVPSPGQHKPELERHRDLLKGIDIDAAEPLTPKLWLSPEDFEAGDRLLKEAGFAPEKTVVLFAGAQYPIRNYPRFGEAIREVCRAQGLSVLALGVESDRDMNRINLDALGAAGVPTLDLSGSLKLRESAALISRCRIAIGTETGLAHIACAVETPNVVLLGGGHFGRFMPYSGLTSIACLPLECYGCNWQCPYLRAHCIADINLRVLQEAFAAALREESDKPRMFVEGHALYRCSDGMPHWGLFNHLVPYQNVHIIPVSE